MKTITTLSSAIALSLTMGTAVATDRANRLLEKFDVNQDGSIVGDEVQFVLTKKFTTADADGNGLLTQDEMLTAHEQRHQERAAERFAELDTDGNASLNVEEFQAGKPPAGKHGGRLERRFSRLDIDGDGMLSSLEINAPLLERFERLDTNQDGVISAEEMQQIHNRGHRSRR